MSTTAQPDRAITTTWPATFDPSSPAIATFAVREVDAPADAVFAWVRRPDLHAPFYPGLRGVRKAGGAWPQVEVGTKLSFFLGALFVPPVKVVQVEPATRSMAWAGGGPGVKACHAFTVVPIDDARSLIRSEEIWTGTGAKLLAPIATGIMQKCQTDWAEAIAAAAGQHPAGPPEA